MDGTTVLPHQNLRVHRAPYKNTNVPTEPANCMHTPYNWRLGTFNNEFRVSLLCSFQFQHTSSVLHSSIQAFSLLDQQSTAAVPDEAARTSEVSRKK